MPHSLPTSLYQPARHGSSPGKDGVFKVSHSKNLSFYEQGNENVRLPLSTYLPQHLGGEDLQRADCAPKTFLGSYLGAEFLGHSSHLVPR